MSDVTVPEPDPIHDPSNLLPGEPPNEEFESPTPTVTTSVVDGTGKTVDGHSDLARSILRDVSEQGTTDAKIRQAIGEAIGAASMCWVGGPGDLVFDSTAATNVANALEQVIHVLNEEMRPGFDEIRATSERLRGKFESELEVFDRDSYTSQRWAQLDDGTLVSDWTMGPRGVAVAVERSAPNQPAKVYVVGRMQEMDPDNARWLGMRLVEAAALAADGRVIP